MRCRACDAALTDREATKKSAVTGEFYDLCSNCLSSVVDAFDLEIIDNPVNNDEAEQE